MEYRRNGGQKDQVAGAEFGAGRLRVLILGTDGENEYFRTILAANVRRWGYEAVPVSAALMREEQAGWKIAGDVLLYDMDVWYQHSTYVGEKDVRLVVSDQHRVVHKPDWPPARLNMVLSSSSISRRTLEQLGAIAWLHKPFDMRALERYLRVFQQLLYGESQAEEASELSKMAIARMDEIAGRAEGSGEVTPRVMRILVADDLEEVTWGIRQCLIEQENRRYHYEVRVVHDGLALLEQCLSWEPHCVVTDLLMPWLNGYQVIRCLASGAKRPVPAFVVISALMRHEFPADRSALQDQMVCYVEKPFDSEDLLNVIEQELARKASQHFEVYG